MRIINNTADEKAIELFHSTLNGIYDSIKADEILEQRKKDKPAAFDKLEDYNKSRYGRFLFKYFLECYLETIKKGKSSFDNTEEFLVGLLPYDEVDNYSKKGYIVPTVFIGREKEIIDKIKANEKSLDVVDALNKALANMPVYRLNDYDAVMKDDINSITYKALNNEEVFNSFKGDSNLSDKEVKDYLIKANEMVKIADYDSIGGGPEGFWVEADNAKTKEVKNRAADGVIKNYDKYTKYVNVGRKKAADYAKEKKIDLIQVTNQSNKSIDFMSSIKTMKQTEIDEVFKDTGILSISKENREIIEKLFSKFDEYGLVNEGTIKEEGIKRYAFKFYLDALDEIRNCKSADRLPELIKNAENRESQLLDVIGICESFKDYAKEPGNMTVVRNKYVNPKLAARLSGTSFLNNMWGLYSFMKQQNKTLDQFLDNPYQLVIDSAAKELNGKYQFDAANNMTRGKAVFYLASEEGMSKKNAAKFDIYGSCRLVEGIGNLSNSEEYLAGSYLASSLTESVLSEYMNLYSFKYMDMLSTKNDYNRIGALLAVRKEDYDVNNFIDGGYDIRKKEKVSFDLNDYLSKTDIDPEFIERNIIETCDRFLEEPLSYTKERNRCLNVITELAKTLTNDRGIVNSYINNIANNPEKFIQEFNNKAIAYSPNTFRAYIKACDAKKILLDDKEIEKCLGNDFLGMLPDEKALIKSFRDSDELDTVNKISDILKGKTNASLDATAKYILRNIYQKKLDQFNIPYDVNDVVLNSDTSFRNRQLTEIVKTSSSSEYNDINLYINKIKGGLLSSEANRNIVMNTLFEIGENEAKPYIEIEDNRYEFSDFREFVAYGKNNLVRKPFLEACRSPRIASNHMTLYMIGKGIKAEDLEKFGQLKNNGRVLTAQESEFVNSMTTTIKSHRQGFMDFISGKNLESVADVYINYIKNFNETVMPIVPDMNNAENISKNINRVAMYAVTQSILLQTLDVNRQTESTNAIVESINRKLKSEGIASSFELFSDKMLAVMQPIEMIGQLTMESDLPFFDNANPIKAGLVINEFAKEMAVARYVKANNELTEELNDKADIKAGRLFEETANYRIDIEDKEDIIKSGMVDSLLGKGNILVPDSEDVNTKMMNHILLGQDENLSVSLFSKNEFDAANNTSKTDFYNMLTNKYNDKAFYNRYEVKRFFDELTTKDSIILVEDKPKDMINRLLKGEEPGFYNNISAVGKDLLASKYFRDNYEVFMSEPEKAAKILEKRLFEKGDDGHKSNTMNLVIARAIELGCRDGKLKNHFMEIDRLTGKNLALNSALFSINSSMELLPDNKKSVLKDIMNKAYDVMENNSGDDFQKKFDLLYDACADYLTKYGKAGNDTEASILNEISMIKDAGENYRTIYFKGKQFGTRAHAYNKELSYVDGGLFNSAEYKKLSEKIKEFDKVGKGDMADKNLYPDELQTLYNAAKEYMEAKGDERRKTDKGQARFNLAKKICEETKNEFTRIDIQNVIKYRDAMVQGTGTEGFSERTKIIYGLSFMAHGWGSKDISKNAYGIHDNSIWYDAIGKACELYNEFSYEEGKKSNTACEKIGAVVKNYKFNICDNKSYYIKDSKTYGFLQRSVSDIDNLLMKHPDFNMENQDYEHFKNVEMTDVIKQLEDKSNNTLIKSMDIDDMERETGHNKVIGITQTKTKEKEKGLSEKEVKNAELK